MGRRVIALATTNPGKVREVVRILEPLGIDVLLPEDLPEVVEDRATFAENARKKAASAAAHLGVPALADDSGLEVAVLGGDPGVRSARYAGEDADAAANNALLVERLQALGAVDPEAAFVCHTVVVAPDGRVLAEGTGRVQGVIRWPERGEGGFGYDPLFHHPPSDRRFAELDPAAKNAISHRGLALRALAERLRDVEGGW